jgi:DNA-directed RNA polymerase subunit M/transcription elongation factor TFIIS
MPSKHAERCPDCGSSETRWETYPHSYADERVVCTDCGFEWEPSGNSPRGF